MRRDASGYPDGASRVVDTPPDPTRPEVELQRPYEGYEIKRNGAAHDTSEEKCEKNIGA